jgi:2-oxoglutarate ferredoxin oxidoreductase subunit alpha
MKTKTKNKKRVLMVGNHVIGQAAIDAGCKFYAGYPITPQNELTAYMADNLPKAGGIFIQAESELAAINMIFGSSAVGIRVMTSSSSPGISLKQEGISYLAACRLPSIIVNMQRGGPGLGNISPSQSDYFQATRGGGHGDYRTIVLAPHNGQELYDLTYHAFDLADLYRMPVLILGDGALGQMAEPVFLEPSKEYRTKKEYKTDKKSWALGQFNNKDPRVIRSLFLEHGALENLNKELKKTYDVIEKKEVRAESFYTDDCKVILVAFGAASRVCTKVMKNLRKEGTKVGLIRPISLWPFPKKIISDAANKKVKFLVVEMNMGQMVEDVRMAVFGKSEVHFYGRTAGIIPSEKEIIKKIRSLI